MHKILFMWFTLAVLGTIVAYTWLIEPRVARTFVVVPAGIVLALGVWHAWRVGEWGMQARAFWPGLRAATFFTAPLVVAVLLAGALRGTLHDHGASLANAGALVLWGGAQQWILQTLVLHDSRRVAGRRGGVIAAALLFAAVHLPNQFLTVMTGVGALGWCAIYSRHPNIVPLALSHAIGTLAVLYAFDDRLTGGLRIGLAYLE
jgi:membrane protease YdiL (CAAX protease family)